MFCKITDLFDLSHTIAAPLFDGKTYPWELLDGIADFIRALGPTLPEDRFEKLLEQPELLRTPIVRNGKKATVGYAPEVWADWE